MWIKTEDGRLVDVSGCAIGPDKEGKALVATYPGGKSVTLATTMRDSRVTRNMEFIEKAIVERRPLVDLT